MTLLSLLPRLVYLLKSLHLFERGQGLVVAGLFDFVRFHFLPFRALMQVLSDDFAAQPLLHDEEIL